MFDHVAGDALNADRGAGCARPVAGMSSDASFADSVEQTDGALAMAVRREMIHRSLSRSVPAARKISFWKVSPLMLKTHLPVDLLARK